MEEKEGQTMRGLIVAIQSSARRGKPGGASQHRAIVFGTSSQLTQSASSSTSQLPGKKAKMKELCR
jgi:hypothetical protein